ncbi:hypothetical protein AC578_6465 [Pseudocercospora eumusae]|uniref:GH16 domain-containing protein n=1 Tax=Pseudocercospora eumusae TaxID=321146 RepID=A0A139HCZ6_9PEZI|nr:hypothetical protein AC578_6465 [Pseudocercospora eumusae]
MHRLPLVGILLAAAGTSVVSAQGPCNPTKGSCPPVSGFINGFTDDFTTLSDVPDNWIIADYAEQYLSFSSNKDEIDWEWSGNDFALKVPTIQTNYFGHGVTGNWDRGTQPRVEKNMTQNFMTYTFDWKPESLTWAINGNVIRTLYAKNQDNNQYRYPQSPSRFHLGLWDAGYKDVAWYTKQWAGGETDLNGFPYSLYVKKVTITPYTSCAQYQATDTTGNTASFKCLNSTDSTSSTSRAAGSSSSPSATSVDPSASIPAVQTDKPDFIPTPAPVPPVNPTDSVGVNPTTSAPPISSGTAAMPDVEEDEDDDSSEEDDDSEDDKPPSTVPSTPSKSCSGAVPTNTQPGTAAGCAKYIQVNPGDTCESIADANGIDIEDFESWNPQAGAECYTLWAHYYVCASEPGQCSDDATAGGSSDVVDNDSSSNDTVATPDDADEDSSGEDDSLDETEDSTGDDDTDGSDDDDGSMPATGTTTENTSAVEEETDVPSSNVPTPTQDGSDDDEGEDEDGDEDDATSTPTTSDEDLDGGDDDIGEETPAPSSTPSGNSDEDDDDEDNSTASVSDSSPEPTGYASDDESDDSDDDATSESTPTPSSYADDGTEPETSSSIVEATPTPNAHTDDDDSDDETEDSTPDGDSDSDDGDDITTDVPEDVSPSSYESVADTTSSAAATPTEYSEESTDDQDDGGDDEINDGADDGEDGKDTSDTEDDQSDERVPATTTPAPTTSAPSTPAQTQASSGDEPAWVYMVDYSRGAPTHMSGTTTATIRVTSLITVTGCPSSVTSCPTSKSTQVYVTETVSSFTTVCPVSELPAISSWAAGSDVPTGYMSSPSPTSYGTASATPNPSANGNDEVEEDDSDSGDDFQDSDNSIDDEDANDDDGDDVSEPSSSLAAGSTTAFQYVSSTTTSTTATPSSYDDSDSDDTDEDEDDDESSTSLAESSTTAFQFVSPTSATAAKPSSHGDDDDSSDTDTADVDEDEYADDEEDEDTATPSAPSAYISSTSSSIISRSTPATPPSYAAATSTPVAYQQLTSSTSTPSSSTLKPPSPTSTPPSSTPKSSSPTSKPTPTPVPQIGCWTHLGCYSEVLGRALRVNKKILSYDNKTHNTNKACSDFCAGHKFFATEYGSECYCGDTLEPGCEPVLDGRCKMRCSGNELAVCGGREGLSLYGGEACVGYSSKGGSKVSSANTNTVVASKAVPMGYNKRAAGKEAVTETTERRMYKPRGSGGFRGMFGWLRR